MSLILDICWWTTKKIVGGVYYLFTTSNKTRLLTIIEKQNKDIEELKRLVEQIKIVHEPLIILGEDGRGAQSSQ
tara:strand:- start:13 stop:234 length:222 start_codon:yes stop_codon:yes gene_type:complete